MVPGFPLSTPGRNFLAVWPSLFVVSMGLMAFVPMLPLYIEERFGIEDPDEVRRWSGLIYGAAPFAAAVCGPFWGALGDRIGRKPMALRAVFGIAAVAALMPLADSPGWLFALRVLQGLLAGYVAPAMVLATIDVPAERQGRAIGQLQVGMAVGLLLGPALGAEVTAWFGRVAVFWVTSGLAVVAGLLLLAIAREDRAALRAAHAARGLGHFAAAVLLLRSRAVALVLACVFVMRLGSMMVEAFVALWVDELGPLAAVAATTAGDRVHAVDRTVALMFSIHAVGQLLFTAAWGRLGDRIGPLRCLAVIALGLGLAQVLAGIWRDIDGFLVARVLAAVFAAGAMTLSYAALGKRVAPADRSLAFACVQSGMQFGMCFGPLLGSALADWSGGIGELFVWSGLILGLAGVAMLAVRRLDRETGAPS
jgi:MFS family permease